jgi:nitrogen fixation protein NifQ
MSMQQYIDTNYQRLAAYPDERPNSGLFKKMLASWCAGAGALPDYMGTCQDNYRMLLAIYFPGADIPDQSASGISFEPERIPERDELYRLLNGYLAGNHFSELLITDIVVAASMGGNHLWQDLGLFSRKDLSELMTTNFPALAEKNDRDMKWKKFLYKQLCIQEGIYTCRSPSCEVCADYAACFGPEE